MLINICLSSCGKMDNSYYEYIKNGESIYPGRPDSVQCYPGKNRVMITWLLTDPNVKRCLILWNEGADSLNISVDRSNIADTFRVVINELEERSYVFTLYSFDENGHRSVRTEADCKVYGAAYESTLNNRLLKEALSVNGNMKVTWGDSVEGSLGTEIRYLDQRHDVKVVLVKGTENLTRMDGLPLGDTLQYRSVSLPLPGALDTFYTAYETVVLKAATPQLLDVSTFHDFVLPGDAEGSNGTTVSNMWNGVLVGKIGNDIAWYRTVNGSGIPHWFTFDMGIHAKITRLVIWQRGTIDEHTLLYANGNPEQWEVWGSNTPDPDGGWDGWVKLADCQSVKPSGLPVGQTTQEDIDHASAGEMFTFPDTAPSVRYLRMKILRTWANTDYVFISELSLYGIED